MAISRTPLRISFIGGGTDYFDYFHKFGGKVLSVTINHYCYLHCRYLPPFFNHKSRIVWSKLEEVSDHNEIMHPAVKAILTYMQVNQGIEINHQGDLPARSGLGTSSAFTVGLLHSLYALRNMMSSKRELACEAIHVERDLLKENVGVQDQIATAYGGLNKITIHADGNFDVAPLILTQERITEFQNHLLLFFTGISRTASDVALDKIKAIPQKYQELQQMQQMVDVAEEILCKNANLDEFGHLLHEAWLLKRAMSQKVSSPFIDNIYETAMKAGALGGKLLGAGGGGFMLFYVRPEQKIKVCEALKDLLLVPFEFETSGSQIIFYDRFNAYSKMAMTRRDYIHLGKTIQEDDLPLTHERFTRLIRQKEVI